MRRLIRCFIFLCCLAFLGSCGGAPALKPHNPMGLSGHIDPEAETAFAKAHILWKDGDICSDPAQAILLLDKTIRLEPAYAAAYLRRGLAKSDLRDWDGAFDDLSRAIRLAPTADAYAFRGLISTRGGNLLGARKDFDRSLAIQSDQHRAWNFRGVLNMLQEDIPAACKDFSNGCSHGDCTGLESAAREGICK